MSEIDDNRLLLLGKIAGGVAHDVASYLSAIDASLAMSEIARARAAVDRAGRLLRFLAQHARSGTPMREVVDLKATVKQTLDVVGRLIPDAVAVPFDYDPRTPPIAGVRVELEQLLLNLVLNACEAMPGGGTLSISIRTLGAWISLAVSDTGCGLESLGASSSTKPGRDGAGLGLGIVRSIVERQGAQIRANPVPRGGTHIEVLFPRLS